ncbi:MAG TPA: CRISPR-associated protein Cas4 [Armatimonadetes bacterium]|nr:CRISPR-associated protein Cas4 [Armatimonadota bacterium]
MLSALQHYSYCPRQCALIHQEQTFTDNVFTIKGHLAHKRVDSSESSLEGGVHIERSLPLYSKKYNLTGKADVVEFLDDGTPYPVEYKHGSRQKKTHDDVQLAAQALCLEEMTGKSVTEGAIYHHKSHRRRIVKITAELRQHTISLIDEVHILIASGKTPEPVKDRALCRACSLRQTCQPDMVANNDRLHRLHQNLFIADGDDG